MTLHISNQNGMNYLTRLTNLSAYFYDLIFRTFWLGQESTFRQRVIGLMDLTGEESVLDVGCGTGTLTSMIAGRMNGKGSVFGVDLAPRMIEVAKNKTRKQGSQVEYRVATSPALPFDSETFEVVVTSLVYHQLMSWEERIRAAGEIWRVLKPEGRYISAEFTKFTLGNLSITHDSLMHKISLFGTELLEESGFHILRKVETTKGIMIISAKKVVRQDVLFEGVIA